MMNVDELRRGVEGLHPEHYASWVRSYRETSLAMHARRHARVLAQPSLFRNYNAVPAHATAHACTIASKVSSV